MKQLVAFVTLLLLYGLTAAQAQQDSVSITGFVLNIHSMNPMPNRTIYLLQEGYLRRSALSDDEGYFNFDSLPAGSYTIRVISDNLSLYKSDVEFVEDANLNLLVDTIQLVELLPISIIASSGRYTAETHKLGPQLITSPDDRRLWNMSGNVRLSGPASEDLSRRCQ